MSPNELVTDHLKLAYHFGLRLARWQEQMLRTASMDADDCCQIAVMELMRCAESFDPCHGVPFRAFASIWLRYFVRRTATTAGRRALLSGGAMDDAPDDAHEPDVGPMQKEEAAALWKAVAHLPPKMAMTVRARMLDGMTLKAIGQREGVTREAIRIRWESALQLLRSDLQHLAAA